MSDNTKIEWTDATWNPITGCSIVSPGCTNCYAMKLAGTRLKHHPTRAGLTIDTKAGPVWNGQVRFNQGMLTQPLKWKRARMIFVCAHGDLFHPEVPDEWIDQVFAVMALAPQHTFQVLTKRPERMREYMLERWQPAPARSIPVGGVTFDFDAETKGEDRRDQVVRAAEEMLDTDKALKKRFADLDNPAHWDADENLKATEFAWPLPNVWLGTSVEDQRRADERIPHLLQTPAAIRFLSAEPILGPIDLTNLQLPGELTWNALGRLAGLHWVIAGGESGPGSRPMHPDWARSLRDQCNAAGVAFFFKQWGAWAPADGSLGQMTNTVLPDGRVREWDPEYPQARLTDPRMCAMAEIGKKAAGRLLDGIEHSGMPT